MKLMFLSTVVFAAIVAQPLVSEDVLEPSVFNEVEHALSRAPVSSRQFAGAVTNDFFATNALSVSKIAIKLVSSQRSDGRWFVGTNDVTSAAVEILKSLIGD